MELNQEIIASLLGDDVMKVYTTLVDDIQQTYEPQTLIFPGKKNYAYEIKFRKSSKTLCACYLQEKKFGFMVILGAKEREIFETLQPTFSKEIVTLYHNTPTYHDGKWLWIEIEDDRHLEACKALLTIKRKPKRK